MRNFSLAFLTSFCIGLSVIGFMLSVATLKGGFEKQENVLSIQFKACVLLAIASWAFDKIRDE